MEKSLQETHAPNGICFGCGPANPKGLKIRSFAVGEELHCTWSPAEHHQAFPGMLNGGILGSVLDCHCNWTAAWHLMKKNQLDEMPCTVTANYSVQLLKPTPAGQELQLRAWVHESTDKKATIHSELSCGGEVCAKCTGLFVAVKPSHPAYHRWG